MRRTVFVALLIFPFVIRNLGASPNPPAARSIVTAAALIAEMNFARQDPARYAGYLEQQRTSSRPDARRHCADTALEETIRFLRAIDPRPHLAFSSGLCLAADEHCREQAHGGVGHGGCHATGPAERIARYGKWAGAWAENIAYGRGSAREIVKALIIDEGVRGHGHRRNIFNPAFNVAGAAIGPHARFGTVCDIDFAGDYTAYADAGSRRGSVF